MALINSHTDEQLVQLMKDGQEAAFTELYKRYWERLLIRAIMQLKSPEDAEELLLDLFARLWRRRETIRLDHGFHTYISAALKYEIIHKLAERRQQRLKAGTVMVELSLLDHPVTQGQDQPAQQRLDLLDLQVRLEATVRRLPEKCQLVFRLSREKGLSDKEIADNLNVSPKTVQNHIHRALQALKSALKQSHRFFL